MGKFQQAVDCFSGIKNMGISPNCLQMQHATRLLLAPEGSKLYASQIVALLATLNTNTKTDTKSQRWFLSHQIAGIDDQSQESVMEDVPLVGSRFVRYGFNAFNYRFIEGGLYGHKIRTSFNGLHDLYSAYIFDNNHIWGYEDTDPATGVPVFCPFSLSDLNAYFNMPDGTNSENYFWHVGFADPNQIQKKVIGIKYNFSLSNIQGLKQVELAFLAETAANVFKVGAYTGGGGHDLSANFGTAMGATNNWIVKNALTGGTIAVTSVTPTTDGWLIAPTTSDPNYPAIDQYFTVEWVAPSSLPVGLTSLYESDKIIVKRTQ